MKNGYGWWLEQDDYEKAVGQLRLSLNGVFEPFKVYGLNVFVEGAIEEVMHLCLQFGKRIRGKDAPIMLNTRYSRKEER